jgi:hypothetical protein
VKRWLLQVLIALDQLGTALVGGWADETMSSYSWRMERAGKPWGRFWRPVVDWLALRVFGQSQHCLKAYMQERTRGQMPPEFR